jgi:ATP-binding protein involved in chromosome partitioning
MPAVTKEQVLEALRSVKDPDLGRDIVALEFVKDVKVREGEVGVTIELTTPACPVKERMRDEAQRALRALPGVTQAEVRMTARTVGRQTSPEDVLKGVRNVVAIGSGKGGVGKSTLTTHLALALAQTGASVGILDADIYGPSIPGMLGLDARPCADEQGRAIPPAIHGVRVMSVAMLVGADAPTIWRGPIASRLLQQFLAAVHWGELDYLLLDLPPGTGDVQLTLAQSAPLNGAVIVTTPQDVALKIARKGLRMFQQVSVPILGVIENMSGFVCPSCGARHDIFSQGGGERTARELGVPFLGRVPLDPRLVQAGDAGLPLLLTEHDSPAAQALVQVAKNLAAQLSIANIHEQSTQPRPKEIHLLDHDPPKIVWEDGAVTVYDPRGLRLACPCAACKQELTGESLVRAGDVPGEVQLAEARPVGRYGLNLVFSDRHGTGIYTFESLRKLGRTV